MIIAVVCNKPHFGTSLKNLEGISVDASFALHVLVPFRYQMEQAAQKVSALESICQLYNCMAFLYAGGKFVIH